MDLRCFVDADHAKNKVTRRSSTGFFMFINMTPVIFHSKKQTTIESSVFGSEFVAMKVAMKNSRGLRFKLRMMGVQSVDPHICMVTTCQSFIIHRSLSPL